MTLQSGSVDFTASIKEVGGIENLARLPYARNMWELMKQFQALPSVDGTWNSLTTDQLSFMLAERELDAKELEAAENGQFIDYDNSFHDPDDEWFYHPETMEEQTDEEVEETRRQLMAKLDNDSKRVMADNLTKMQSAYERNKESHEEEDHVSEIIDDRIKAMYTLLDGKHDDELRDFRQAAKKHKVNPSQALIDEQKNTQQGDSTMLNMIDGNEE